MREDEFFTAEARQRTAEIIKAIEEQTSAEVVVAVRPRSDFYRHTDYLFGFGVSLATLSALLFLPIDFDHTTWPLEVVIAFALGAGLCASVAPLKRALTPRRTMQQQVARAARAAFVDLGIGNTRDRSGLLVYVSLLERSCEAVPDVGVSKLAEDEAYGAAVAKLCDAVRAADADAFFAALEGLGPPLARLFPRREDDVNELADEVDHEA